MEPHDLDIDNYDLEELLKLFHLRYNFNEDDLKEAWKICLKTHPDKSGLDSDYFIFYRKAYKVVSEIFYFRGKKKRSTKYTIEINKEHQEILKPLQQKKEFNIWFNKMFEKIKVNDNEHDHGYQEWLKQDIEERKRVPLSQFNEEFYRLKKDSQALVKVKKIEDYLNNCGTNLIRNKPTEYSSDIFSRLKYNDLKKAHTETVIPVTKDDVNLRPKFGSINDLEQYRDNYSKKPISIAESRAILMQQAEEDGKNNVRRAFKIIKQDEENSRANKKWWGYLKQLGAT